MHDLSKFDVGEATLCAAKLRKLGADCRSLERASERIVRFFCDEFQETSGQSSFVLARCYKTHDFAKLPEDLAAFARGVFPSLQLEANTQCLTLLASHGDVREWQSRRTSRGHKAIPLVNEEVLTKLPMVAQLTSSLGIEARQVVRPDPELLLEKERRGFDVFHVEVAQGSPYIPAQDFVTGHGVRSVVGYGCVLPPTSVFAVILFCRTAVPPERAALFKILAASLKLALTPLARGRVFEDHPQGPS